MRLLIKSVTEREREREKETESVHVKEMDNRQSGSEGKACVKAGAMPVGAQQRQCVFDEVNHK